MEIISMIIRVIRSAFIFAFIFAVVVTMVIAINAIRGMFGEEIRKALGVNPERKRHTTYNGPMKCPKCGKSYDSSWTVCLSCQVPLMPSEKTKKKSSHETGESLFRENF